MDNFTPLDFTHSTKPLSTTFNRILFQMCSDQMYPVFDFFNIGDLELCFFLRNLLLSSLVGELNLVDLPQFT